MKDGRMVQLSKPEEMVLNPADDYVAEFAKNAPRDRIVSVRAIMEKSSGETRGAENGINGKAKIGEVAEQVLNSSTPISVLDEAGHVVGSLSRERMVSALYGKEGP